MATLVGTTSSTINIVTSGTTVTNTRGITAITTSAGTNLSIVKMKVPFQKRVSESSKRFLFFLAERPAYLPNVNQKVLIHHADLPVSSAIDNYFVDQSTNVAVGSFVRLAIMGNTATPPASRDGFTYALDVMYDDDVLGYIAGDCDGMIEYDVSPLNYDILKPIESNVVVTERVPYDLSEGDNYLIGASSATTQTRTDVAPMLFVDRGDSNTVFSNLFKSFNLPITAGEIEEFTQSTLGTWTDSTAGTLYYNGKKGYWTAGGTGTTITHPVTGYTGMFYNTAYEALYQNRILVMEIPQTQYGEIIDGKSLKVRLPKAGGATFYDIYGAYKNNNTEYELGKMDNYMSEHDFSAAYFGMPAVLTNTVYESNVVLLFNDDIATPNSTGSWATGHDEVMQGEKCYNPTSVVKKKFFDFYEDTPVGIAYLDKGFVVITDPTIVSAVYNQYTGSSYNNVTYAANIITNFDGMNLDRNNSQFLFKSSYITNPTVNTFVEYLSYNTEKSLNVVCLASANEFYRTTNDTAKVLDNVTDQDFAEFKNPISGNLYPIVITELGLHDQYGNLLAIVKPTEPIKKYWYDVVSFSIKIRL
jgi:hypothetical protein